MPFRWAPPPWALPVRPPSALATGPPVALPTRPPALRSLPARCGEADKPFAALEYGFFSTPPPRANVAAPSVFRSIRGLDRPPCAKPTATPPDFFFFRPPRLNPSCLLSASFSTLEPAPL